MSSKTGINLRWSMRYLSPLIIAALVPLSGWSKDNVQTYRVPKESTGAAKPVAPTASREAKPLTWTTPDGWIEQPGTKVRIGQFSVPGPNGTKAELAITAFPGPVGDEISNVNRWRGEIGLEPVSFSDLNSEKVEVGSESAKFYQFTGPQKGTTVAWVMKDNASWFFKLRGDKEAVTAAKPALIGFLKSVRFQGAPSLDEADVIGTGMNPHNPHESGGMPGMSGMAGMPAGHPPMGGATVAEDNSNLGPMAPQPAWQTPGHWKEQKAPRMVVKSFAVTGDKGKAAVTISTFPGQVGGLLANVNRWRHQLGLDDIKEAELAKNTQAIELPDGKASLVDFSGKDANAPRLIAVMVPHGDGTWFYKLLGDSPVVESEKENLIKVIKTVRYP